MELLYENQKRLFDYCMVFDSPRGSLGPDSDPERPLVSMSDVEVDIHDIAALARKDVSNEKKINLVRVALTEAGLVLHESESPDGGQLYLCIHAPMRVLMNFAEQNQILMHTMPEIGTGEAPEPFIRSAHHRFHRTGTPVFTTIQRQRLTLKVIKTDQMFGGAGIEVDDLRRDGLVKQFFPLHNAEEQEILTDKWASLRRLLKEQPLDRVRSYFGEKVALYFSWLGFYTSLLVFPAIAGILLAIVSATTSTQGGGVIFTLLLLIWGACFTIFWQRREATLAQQWGVDIEQDQEPLSDNYEGEWRPVDIQRLQFQYPLKVAVGTDGVIREKYFPTWKRAVRIWLVSCPVILLLITALLTVLVLITDWRFTHTSPTETTIASALTVGTMTVFNLLYGRICSKLNLFENYRTDTGFENAMIRKSFVFQFCNAYSALFIIALWPKPGDRMAALSSQLLFILVVKPAIQNTQELLLPFLKNKIRYYADIRKDKTLAERMTPIDLQANLEPYATPLDDYLEIALQFGYMCMFAVAFPLGPAVSLLWNLLEIRIDSLKLTHECQRPPAVAVKDIGAWGPIFKFLVIVSALTNMYILCFLSEPFAEFGLNTRSDFARASSFIVSQYVGYMAIAAVWLVVAPIPTEVLKAQACQDFFRQQQLLEQRKQTAVPMTMLEGTAAVKIQRNFRGARARKHVARLKEERSHSSSSVRPVSPDHVSAHVLSEPTLHRADANGGSHDEAELERLRAEQAEAERRYLEAQAEAEAERQREERLAAELRERHEAERAAVKIQAGMRGMTARKTAAVLRSQSQIEKERQEEERRQREEAERQRREAHEANERRLRLEAEAAAAAVAAAAAAAESTNGAHAEPDVPSAPAQDDYDPPSNYGGSSVADHDSLVHFEGWLSKKGAGAISGWKRRFFVLDGVYLAYFDDKGGKEKGVFNVFQAVVIDEKDTHFSIEGPYAKRRVNLQAASAAEKAEWVTQLWKAINSATETAARSMHDTGADSD